MLALLLLQTMFSATYQIPEKPCVYDLDIKMNGFIPLFGLNDGASVELQVGMKVTGLPAEGDGNPRASADVSDLKVILNGSSLPFTRDNVAQYFPNTVTFTPQGKVVKNNAPNIELPVHLPGLDMKRFPDITFLAVEFPAEGIVAGKSWTYSREFGDSTVAYTVTPTSVTSDTAKLDIALSQDYEEKEGDSFEVVKNPKDDVYDVKTHVQGVGKLEFDLKRGLVRKLHVDADAVGQVTKIDTKETSKRDLKTTLDVALKG